MVITYYGGACVKVSFGDITLAFNPISKKSNFKQSRFGADIALVSLNVPDANGIEQVTHGDKDPFVIDSPGEYEIKSVTVRGMESESSYDKHQQHNTVYLATLEGMNLCHLGFADTAKLPNDMLEVIERVDVLFVPVGEKVLSPADAHELSVKLEARITIPILYDDKTLKQFLKEGGHEDVKPIDKLTIKKKELEETSGDIVVLKAP